VLGCCPELRELVVAKTGRHDYEAVTLEGGFEIL
jgi:hypothetical protein